MDDEMIITWG